MLFVKKNKEYFLIIVLSILIFFSFIKIYTNTDFNNCDNTHSWLSMSTVKFTNNWLKEGPIKLRFLMLESPKSIESSTIDSRSPYLSYPSGTIIVTYISALLMNKTQIGISFIKHLVTFLYLLNTIGTSIFVYMLVKKLLYKINKWIPLIISLFLSTIWMLIPANVYYLTEVLFSDQLILIFALIYIIFEFKYEDIVNLKNKLLKNILLTIYYIIAIFGVYTDWYFVILMFVAFVLRIIKTVVKCGNFKNYFKNCMFKNILQYGIPVIIGMLIFAVQISSIDNGITYIINISKYRLGLTEDNGIQGNFYKLIYKKLFDSYGRKGIFTIILGFLSLIYIAFKTILKRNTINDRTRMEDLIYIATLIMLGPFLQLIILKNHSAIHEFSILKTGISYIMSFILISYSILEFFKININDNMQILLDKSKKYLNINIFFCIILFIFIYLMLFSNIILNTSSYVKARQYSKKQYIIENYIAENARYEDVYFSFDYKIPNNPPQQLAISNKKVYKIDKIEDIYKKFPNLTKDAVINIILNKEDVKNLNVIKERYIKIVELEDYVIYRKVDK